MESTYSKALGFVLLHEGGFSSDPADSGGETNFGITHGEYYIYRQSKGLPAQSVRLISQAEVQDIYRTLYWDKVGGSKLPYPLDFVMLDTSVNNGVGYAHKLYLLVKLMAPAKAAAWALHLRALHYRAIVAFRPRQRVFLNGWLNRIQDLRKAIGVV